MPSSIAVLIKQVPDMNAMRVDRSTGQPVMSGQMAISSYDDYAIEEALLLKERFGGEITAIAAGGPSVKDAVNRALAMGADRGEILAIDNVNDLDTFQLSRILADHLRPAGHDIILAGQVSDDYATGQVGPQVAELLGISSLGSIVSVEVEGDRLTVVRDTEDGRQTLSVPTPVVLLAQAGLNEPRYPSLKGIMAAKKKPLETIDVARPDSTSRLSWGAPYVPEKTNQGILVQEKSAPEAAKLLVAWLKEQKLI